MIAQRAAIFLAGAASLAVFTMPASAQVPDNVVLEIMRQCARIDDPSARLACYDNNIRNAGANPRNTVPGETVVTGGPGVTTTAPNSGAAVTGFGREDVRTPERFNDAPAGELAEIRARVQSVTMRQPGIYVLTLEDGAQWLFTDSVDNRYSVPRQGSTIEISRASLGSFLMRYNNQRSVRVRRIQ